MAPAKLFIDYWDKVIKNWMAGKICPIQQHVLNIKKLNLEQKDMPEPYWGNPLDCSLVIINYNPGGSANDSCHTTLGYKNRCDCTLFRQVEKRGYSDVALPFPLLDVCKGRSALLRDRWLETYAGHNWWLKRKKWILQIVDSCKESMLEKGIVEPKKDKKPFAIELCGWHSQGWPTDGAKLMVNDVYVQKEVKDYFIYPLIDAILHYSDYKIGICIGKGFENVFQPNGFKDITISVGKKLSGHYTITTGNDIQPIPSVKRYYKVFQKVSSGQKVNIINTWTRGSNVSPANKFKYFEADLISHL